MTHGPTWSVNNLPTQWGGAHENKSSSAPRGRGRAAEFGATGTRWLFLARWILKRADARRVLVHGLLRDHLERPVVGRVHHGFSHVWVKGGPGPGADLLDGDIK